MAALNPYVNFPGNTEEAFNFYKSVFGTEFIGLYRFSDMPESGKMPENERSKIMHIALPIGKSGILMGTDALESQGHKLSTGNNIQLSLTAESEAEADKLFNGLSAGGQVIVPIGKSSWNSYFALWIDKFGMTWMVNYDYN